MKGEGFFNIKKIRNKRFTGHKSTISGEQLLFHDVISFTLFHYQSKTVILSFTGCVFLLFLLPENISRMSRFLVVALVVVAFSFFSSVLEIQECSPLEVMS